MWLASRAGEGEVTDQSKQRITVQPTTNQSTNQRTTQNAQEWAAGVARRAAGALEALWGAGYFAQAAANRLAFREFGTTLGVQAHPATARRWAERVDALHAFWAPRAFSRDADITPIMFASSLLPGAWLRGFDARARREA